MPISRRARGKRGFSPEEVESLKVERQSLRSSGVHLSFRVRRGRRGGLLAIETVHSIGGQQARDFRRTWQVWRKIKNQKGQ